MVEVESLAAVPYLRGDLLMGQVLAVEWGLACCDPQLLADWVLTMRASARFFHGQADSAEAFCALADPRDCALERAAGRCRRQGSV